MTEDGHFVEAMFGNRRPGKRSIIGTRVCAPNDDDGLYYPGVIQAIAPATPGPPGDPTAGGQSYFVLFDDGSSMTFGDRDLIGSGFRTFTAAHAKPGQVVYITHHGREVRGRIVKKDGRPTVDEDDQVTVAVGQCPDEVTVTIRIDDVRLVESRKSARLIDQEMDYIRLADLPTVSEGKKRTVSNVIDVPTPCAKLSRGSYSRSHDHGEIQQNGAFRNSRDIETEIMDEHMAALVLTSLSCSPVSPVFPPNLLDQAGVSPGKSYCNGQDWETSDHASSPSPPQLLLSQSAPAKVNMFTSFCFDEGTINGDVSDPKAGASKRTVFQCTWPGCNKIYNTCPGIEKHVRLEHLGPKEDGNMSASDHEEDFYFTEVEVTLDTVMQTFADMHTSSPSYQTVHPSTQFRLPPDHDYQRKEFRSTPLTIPKASFSSDHHYPGTSLPMSMLDQENHCNHSWQPNDQLQDMSLAKSFDYGDLSHGIHFASSGSKSSSSHKKSRNDVKKCRKVYGLENRSSWCTQCKWKKACTRFLEKSDVT